MDVPYTNDLFLDLSLLLQGIDIIIVLGLSFYYQFNNPLPMLSLIIHSLRSDLMDIGIQRAELGR